MKWTKEHRGLKDVLKELMKQMDAKLLAHSK